MRGFCEGRMKSNPCSCRGMTLLVSHISSFVNSAWGLEQSGEVRKVEWARTQENLHSRGTPHPGRKLVPSPICKGGNPFNHNNSWHHVTQRTSGISPTVQRLGLHLPRRGVQVQSLVEELGPPSHPSAKTPGHKQQGRYATNSTRAKHVKINITEKHRELCEEQLMFPKI